MDLLIATLVALCLAHVLADFVFQTHAMVAAKQRAGVFALHIALVAATAALLLGLTGRLDGVIGVAGLSLAHALIDWIKTRAMARPGGHDDGLGPLRGFMLDQGAHAVSIGLVVCVLPDLFAHGFWPALFEPARLHWLLLAWAALTGALVATRAGALAIGLLMDGLSGSRSSVMPMPCDHQPAIAAEDDTGRRARELRAGVWIGWLERALVFTFVLVGQFNAIGLVIAAKSILRFEYARKSAQSELVIIGTLASFGWAVGAALLTLAAFRGLS